MKILEVEMTWCDVKQMPIPFIFGKCNVRANRFDSSRIYINLEATHQIEISSTYRQIQIWLLSGRCTSIKYTYTGHFPIQHFKSIGFKKVNEHLWRKEHQYLSIYAVKLNDNKWVVCIENRKDQKGVPIEHCEWTSFSSYQLTLDGEVIVATS
ncbi:hypothetical protein PaeCFBP13512_22275 [Paenibacillus sp. CFBP13512]|uniref:hypothetical protein n=1 Tax=Paenibacillus sp. CFBP13512 TaxID=2184007 RepID=UPI0010C04A0C|nr:hypothetical protein [Paenibacillus sp. CFBP13512]TKJ83850.1 hypothetical protein PaeCFBP13512_22275 [Paenibacillus sp. CFBP13512]